MTTELGYKATGLNSTTSVLTPIGSIIERAYWSAPHGYVNPGPEYATELEALEAAVERMKGEVARYELNQGSYWAKEVPLPERITIDLRWFIRYPQPKGGGVDAVISRFEYENIAAAEAAIERHKKFSRG